MRIFTPLQPPWLDPATVSTFWYRQGDPQTLTTSLHLVDSMRKLYSSFISAALLLCAPPAFSQYRPIPSHQSMFRSLQVVPGSKQNMSTTVQLSSQFALRFHDSTLRRRKRAPCSPLDNPYWPIARLQINNLFYLGIGPCSIAPLQ